MSVMQIELLEVIVSRYYHSVYNRFHPTLSIGGVAVAASDSLRILGVTLRA